MERNVMGELNVYRGSGAKPNFSEIARRHGMDRHTVAKYWREGESAADGRSARGSAFDPLEEVIRSKAQLPGMTKMAVYAFLREGRGEGLPGYGAFTAWCRAHDVPFGGAGGQDAEDTVEVRRFDQAVPAVRVQCAAPPARVAVRVLIRLMMAHLNPKALQHVVEPEIELRLDALAERIAQGELRHLRHTAVQPLNLCHRVHGASPFRHGIVSSTRPLPIRTNITRQGEAPEGRAPQHEAESAPGWTGQQRRSTRNRRGVTTVPASVSLGQVMMPTNPEMLQRSAERA